MVQTEAATAKSKPGYTRVVLRSNVEGRMCICRVAWSRNRLRQHELVLNYGEIDSGVCVHFRLGETTLC